MMVLIVGLGNPGKGYVNNRHNVGFHCVEFLAQKFDISLAHRKLHSKLGTGSIDGVRVILAKPMTFMNLSGQAVESLMRYYHVTLENLLVIYDDLALPLGKLRIRQGGSSGGHKGMRSIISCVGSQEFPRVRVGISPVENENNGIMRDVVGHVLGNFTDKEKSVIREAYSQACEAVSCILSDGIDAAMNKYN